MALAGGVVCLFAVVYFNLELALLFLGLLIVGYVYFRLTERQREEAPHDEMLAGAADTPR